jgi:hypothetical protein
MSPFARSVLSSAAIAVLATAAVWLFVMPDEPQRAADDGVIAALVASIIVTEKVRRDSQQG